LETVYSILECFKYLFSLKWYLSTLWSTSFLRFVPPITYKQSSNTMQPTCDLGTTMLANVFHFPVTYNARLQNSLKSLRIISYTSPPRIKVTCVFHFPVTYNARLQNSLKSLQNNIVYKSTKNKSHVCFLWNLFFNWSLNKHYN